MSNPRAPGKSGAAGAAGGSPPRQPLIQYAPPPGYKPPNAPDAAAAASSSPPVSAASAPVPTAAQLSLPQSATAASSSSSSSTSRHTRASSTATDATDDGFEGSQSRSLDHVQISEMSMNENERGGGGGGGDGEIYDGEEEEGEGEEGKDGEPIPPSSPMRRSPSSILMEEISRGMISAIRGTHDDGPLVEDHILETMDFDKDEDYVNEEFMERKTAIHRHLTLFTLFIMTVAIAFVTAMCMFVVSHSVEFFSEFKVETVLSLIEQSQPAGAYFVFIMINILLVTTAAAMVAIAAPHARGGGVPYVLAYLNGTNVMDYFSLRIVATKTLSLIFTIAGGLTLGMEGPFVFIGGGVAAILNSATDIIFPFFPRHSSYAKIIRSIREERIFMAGGMAAGLAVAFDAPIAGVLFALEGSTAFLSAPVVLRIFGCAMFASFFNDLGHTNFSKYIKNHNLLEVSNSGKPSPYAWTLLEVFPFFVIGVTGGVVGAMVSWVEKKKTEGRQPY